MTDPLDGLRAEIAACRVCAAALPAGCRPVARLGANASLLIISQAPGTRAHASGVPFEDPSGNRLRQWTGLSKEVFYDTSRVAIMPMGLCFPGTGKTGDLPPRRECAPLWHERILAQLPARRLTLLVGAYAQRRYLPTARKLPMTEIVRGYAGYGPEFFPLPHPSWRSNVWMMRNPWFEVEILPALRARLEGIETLGL